MTLRQAVAALAAVVPLVSSLASEAPLGRTMRSMVKGAAGALAPKVSDPAFHAITTTASAPSTPLRPVPLLRVAEEDKAPAFSTLDNLPRDVARSITACWHAPHEGDEITLRMSFRRDGSVFGKPRITYMRAADGPDGQAALANSIYAAIGACTPLRFTPSLGAAIAGRIFLIRFVALRREQRASL